MAPFECEALQSAYRNRVHEVDGTHISADIKFVNQVAKNNAKIQHNAFIEAEYNKGNAEMRPLTPTKRKEVKVEHNEVTHEDANKVSNQNKEYMAVCTVCGFSCKDNHQIKGAATSDYLIVVDIKTGMPSVKHTTANIKEKLEKYIKMLDDYVCKQEKNKDQVVDQGLYSNDTIINVNKNPTSTQNKNISNFLKEYKKSINDHTGKGKTESSEPVILDEKVSNLTSGILLVNEEKGVLNYGGDLQKLIDGILAEYTEEEKKKQI